MPGAGRSQRSGSFSSRLDRQERSGSFGSHLTHTSTRHSQASHHHFQDDDVAPFREELYREEEREEHPEGITKEEEEKEKEAAMAADEVDPYLVRFEPNDPTNPRNFSFTKKWVLTAFLGLLCFNVAIGSSMPTGDLPGSAKKLGVSQEAINLVVTLFVMGFGFGPVVFAPLSEVYGRYPVYVFSGFIYFIFTMACAVAPNLATLLAARMIAGLAASVPMTNMGGSLSDMWSTEEKGNPMTIFSSVIYLGPSIGPVIGGAISSGTNELHGWRYIYWTLFGFIGVVWIITLFHPETLASAILKRKARKLRNETNDDRYIAPGEGEKMSIKAMAVVLLLRPVILLFTEPIVLFFSLYLTLVYMLLYLLFFAYPIIFLEGHKFNDLQTGLMFIPLIVGILFSIVVTMFVVEPWTKRKVQERGTPRTPEDRLTIMFIGSVLLPCSLFALAWTSMPHVHWAAPMVTGLGTGMSFVMIYNAANSYLVDCYPKVAASALAAKTLIRSMGGAAVPLFVEQMFHSMHNQWALTLVAFVSLAMLPIPFFFHRYGPKYRAKSKYATGDDEK